MLCRKLLRVEESGGEVQVWRLCPPEEQEDREQDQVACRGEAERSPSPFLMLCHAAGACICSPRRTKTLA